MRRAHIQFFFLSDIDWTKAGHSSRPSASTNVPGAPKLLKRTEVFHWSTWKVRPTLHPSKALTSDKKHESHPTQDSRVTRQKSSENHQLSVRSFTNQKLPVSFSRLCTPLPRNHPCMGHLRTIQTAYTWPNLLSPGHATV